MPSLVEIGPLVPEKKMKMWKVYDNNDDEYWSEKLTWAFGSGELKFGVAYHLKGPAGPNIMQGKVRHVFKKNESEAEQSFGYIKIKMYLNNTSRNVGWERLRIPHTQFYFVESVLPSLSI